MTAIKICDIRTPEIAAYCAALRVDMIGLHCIWDVPSPDRMVELRRVCEVAQPNCKCVLVTRQTEVSIVAAMAVDCAWDYLQLHANWNPDAVVQLGKKLRVRGRAPGLIGVVVAASASCAQVEELAEVTDLVLLDSSIRGGSGKLAAAVDIQRAAAVLREKPFLIAGGLRQGNVLSVIREHHPWGVDVQSGVEYPDGTRRKDPNRMRRFVDVVRSSS